MTYANGRRSQRGRLNTARRGQSIRWVLASALVMVVLGSPTRSDASARNVMRDRASFTTPEGKSARLELWVRGGVEREAAGIEDGPDCPGGRMGVPLTGRYSLRLVVDGHTVNTVAIPSPYEDDEISLPLRNSVANNAAMYGGRMPRDDVDGARIEPTRLLALRDVTGDGRSYEFRLVSDGACSHAETLLAGYSPKRGRAVVYLARIAGKATAWPMDLYPDPSSHAKGRLSTRWGCGDHGAETDYRATYVFDQRTERWEGRATEVPCP